MTTLTPVRSVHAALSGTTADSITWTGGPYHSITVTNFDTSVKLYVRFDGAVAVSAADGTFVIGPSSWKTYAFVQVVPAVLSVVGSGNVYAVEGGP